jgi:hypothetical protein
MKDSVIVFKSNNVVDISYFNEQYNPGAVQAKATIDDNQLFMRMWTEDTDLFLHAALFVDSLNHIVYITNAVGQFIGLFASEDCAIDMVSIKQAMELEERDWTQQKEVVEVFDLIVKGWMNGKWRAIVYNEDDHKDKLIDQFIRDAQSSSETLHPALCADLVNNITLQLGHLKFREMFHGYTLSPSPRVAIDTVHHKHVSFMNRGKR